MESGIGALLRYMVEIGASDLHLKAMSVPGFRVDGRLRGAEEFGCLTPDRIRSMAHEIMTPRQRQIFETEKDIDFSHSIPSVARFRINVLCQRGTVSLVVRQIPDAIPELDDLGLPPVASEMCRKVRGMVLVTGPTGCGKSTTLAAMIDYINTHREGHIITMEDPLEFIHPDKRCFVTQRQIGQDCSSFTQALRRALRQDPDVILVGEMRDLETISMALTAAETGHLVLGTLHTIGATATVDRVIDAFPNEAQEQARVALATTLQGVISQVLLPRRDGGRVAAREILVATDGVRSLIRDGKTAQLGNLQQTGKSQGMLTLEQALADLVLHNTLTIDTALGACNRPDELLKFLEQRGYQMPTDSAAAKSGAWRRA
ncbi:MAG: type IV pilus twitching motility protein PilT [Planctomycetota bacterium]